MSGDVDPAAFVAIYATFPSLEEAERIGGAVVEQGLAACVNILPGMVSIYVWKEERHREQEVAALIKTRAVLAGRVMETVARLHPYETPALVVLPFAGGAQSFLRWIADQTAAAQG